MESGQTKACGAEAFPLINGQHLPPWRDMPYGTSDLSWSGCEAIAAYNLMALIGRPEPLRDVVTFFERDFANRLMSGWGMGGRWGAAPWDIRRFLKSRGVPFAESGSLRGLEKRIGGPGVLLLSYWNKPVTSGYHTVAAAYDGTRFTAYNQNCDSRQPVTADSPGAFMAGPGRLIRGFFVPLCGEDA